MVVGLDSGFDAYPVTDPVIIGNSSGTGSLSGLDAAYVAQKAVLLLRPEIPDLPADLPSPSPSGPDPVIGAPVGIVALAGQSTRVPIGIDNLAGLLGATVTVRYDTGLLNLANDLVTLGTALEQAGWSLVQNVDDVAGTARLVAYRPEPGSAGATALFELNYQVPPAASGATPIDLSGPMSDGGFSFTYIDGSLTVGLEGDLNADGRVGLRDLVTLRQHLGTTSGAQPADGDLDGDGDVDRTDLSRLISNYGRTTVAPPQPVVANPVESSAAPRGAMLRGVRRPTRAADRQAAVDRVLTESLVSMEALTARRR